MHADPIQVYSLAGATLEIPDGCYSYPMNDNQTNYEGISKTQCLDECFVRLY